MKKQVGGQAFLISQEYVDGVSLVSEKYIALAVLRLLEIEKYVVEGGGASGLAAILPGGPLNTPALKGEPADCLDFLFFHPLPILPSCGLVRFERQHFLSFSPRNIPSTPACTHV